MLKTQSGSDFGRAGTLFAVSKRREWELILSQAGLRNETTIKYNGNVVCYDSCVPVMSFSYRRGQNAQKSPRRSQYVPKYKRAVI